MINNKPINDDVPGDGDSYQKEEKRKSDEKITFYYDREERLKKLNKLITSQKRTGFFKRGGKRTLLVILIDLMIISLFIYFINRPTNFYKKKIFENIQYELNISGIKGKKVMFALTLTNKAEAALEIPLGEKILIDIVGKDENRYELKKMIGVKTILQPEESTSVVFIVKENKLPKVGIVKVFVGENSNKPIFSQRIRFYYFNF